MKPVSRIIEWNQGRFCHLCKLRYHVWILLLVAPLLLNACLGTKAKPSGITTRTIGDRQGIARYPHTSEMATFTGQVLSSEMKPISNAAVEIICNIGRRHTKTDKRGYFQIAVPEGGKKGAKRYVMNIRKEGFGFLSKVYPGGVQGKQWVMPEATVMKIDPSQSNLIQNVRPSSICTGTLSSQVDWSLYENRRTPRKVDRQGEYAGEPSDDVKRAVKLAEDAEYCNEGVSVFLPANSLVDTQGNLPQEEVSVSLSTIDIYDPDSMPGDYSYRSRDGNPGYMLTFGAGTINTYGKNKTYQLRKGKTATLTIPINPVQRKLMGEALKETIPLLLYDEKIGVWRDFGAGKLNKEKTAYIAEVDHFSAFNMDLVKSNQACVRINSSAIADDYDLEVSLMWAGDFIVRTNSIDNTPEKLHVVYNLPSNTDIAIRGFKTNGSIVIPITDTVSVNTGIAQNPPEPNLPEYPYTACQPELTLTERALAPSLSGPADSYGDFTLSWEYTWPPGLVSSSDGYQLEESTASATGPFTNIYSTFGTGDHRTSVAYPLTKSTGNYWYRVKANTINGWTPYSNVFHVAVDSTNTTTTPNTLRIINNLNGGVDQYGNDWGKLNNIIRVRVSSTCDNVVNGYGELLYPHEWTDDPGNLQIIPPGSHRDFDISNVILSADNSYCVFIQTGWWDTVLDVNTHEFLYYEKRNSNVLDCNGNCCLEKWVYEPIVQPFFEPEEIRVHNYLPHTNWIGHPSCP